MTMKWREIFKTASLKSYHKKMMRNLESGDEGVIYYVSGFVSNSLTKNEKCEECINLMVEDRK